MYVYIHTYILYIYIYLTYLLTYLLTVLLTNTTSSYAKESDYHDTIHTGQYDDRTIR